MEHTDWHDIEPGIDAVFLPGKIHDSESRVYIIYLNECANDGNGSFEIEVVDAERILKLNEYVDGDAEAFFDLLPDWFQGEWYYCDNRPGYEDSFQSYADAYYDADYIGSGDDELGFLVEKAKKVVNGYADS